MGSELWAQSITLNRRAHHFSLGSSGTTVTITRSHWVFVWGCLRLSQKSCYFVIIRKSAQLMLRKYEGPILGDFKGALISLDQADVSCKFGF
jgi:hypothetical protein